MVGDHFLSRCPSEAVACNRTHSYSLKTHNVRRRWYIARRAWPYSLKVRKRITWVRPEHKIKERPNKTLPR